MSIIEWPIGLEEATSQSDGLRYLKQLIYGLIYSGWRICRFQTFRTAIYSNITSTKQEREFFIMLNFFVKEFLLHFKRERHNSDVLKIKMK